MNDERQIVYNAIITPDGTILESRNRHDYVTHLDANGEEYMNDGGTSYIRRNKNVEEYTDITLYSDSPHEKIRECITWGTYGIKGDQPLNFIKLKDMETDHIKNILSSLSHIENWRRNIFENELKYRESGF